MIGGMDVTLAGPTSPAEMLLALKYLHGRWPKAIAEDQYDHRLTWSYIPPLSAGLELFVFRDPAAAESWRESGATEENSDSLVHLIFEPDCLTLVVDSGASETRRLADELIALLRQNRMLRSTPSSRAQYKIPVAARRTGLEAA